MAPHEHYLEQVRDINAHLPFADPIARVLNVHGHELVLYTIPWRTHFRIMRAVKRRRL